MGVGAKPLYFLVTFWGKEYRDYFLNLTLASLLAPGNIPAVCCKESSKILIATTLTDWLELQNSPLIIQARSFVEIQFFQLDFSKDENKMAVLSKGHKLISEYAFQEKAIGFFLASDLVLADGAVFAALKLLSTGKKVVLCSAIRYDYDGCMKEFKELDVMHVDKPFVISSRQLMSVALKNLHSESKTWLWDSMCYSQSPVVSMWEIGRTTNYVLHGYSWLPLAVNFDALDKHDVSTFNGSTLDQDYVYRNFGITDDVYVVTDSDEIAIASFTKESDLSISLSGHVSRCYPLVGKLAKKYSLNNFHYCPIHDMDLLKRHLVLKTVLLHSDEITRDWEAVIRKAKNLVSSSVKRPFRFRKFFRVALAEYDYAYPKVFNKACRLSLENYDNKLVKSIFCICSMILGGCWFSFVVMGKIFRRCCRGFR